MSWENLSINIVPLDCNRLLSDWRWLVPEDLRPFELTIFGDWFFEDADGRVVFLDTVGGRLTVIAPSRSAFLTDRENPENKDEWYMPDLARRCRDEGLCPSFGQCLSFTIPPVLSGPMDASNVEVCDLMVHLSSLGQIHQGVKNVPDGTQIDGFVELEP
jgi:hypothetical protein